KNDACANASRSRPSRIVCASASWYCSYASTQACRASASRPACSGSGIIEIGAVVSLIGQPLCHQRQMSPAASIEARSGDAEVLLDLEGGAEEVVIHDVRTLKAGAVPAEPIDDRSRLSA